MDLVVDDAMHPPADQSSRPGKENGNQFFRTGHWVLGRFWDTSMGQRAGQGGRGPCFFHVSMGNKLIHETSDYLIPKYFNLSLCCGQLFLVSHHDQDKNVLFLLPLPLSSDNDGHQSAGQVAYIGHTMHTI